MGRMKKLSRKFEITVFVCPEFVIRADLLNWILEYGNHVWSFESLASLLKSLVQKKRIRKTYPTLEQMYAELRSQRLFIDDLTQNVKINLEEMLKKPLGGV